MNNMKNFFVIFLMFTISSVYANPGKDIFDKYCTVCHSPSMAPMFNSPAAHDLNAWNERKNDAFNRAVEENTLLKNLTGDEKEKQAIKSLVSSAIAGTDKGMPPMGTCADCSEEDLKAAIEFMSSAD